MLFDMAGDCGLEGGGRGFFSCVRQSGLESTVSGASSDG